jgi:hypothetical protein
MLSVPVGQRIGDFEPFRLGSEASFARLCGAAPLPASSGLTTRHRLNRGGAPAGLLRAHHPAPAEPRRRPLGEQRAVADRHRADAPGRQDSGVRGPPDARRAVEKGDHPMLEAIHRQGGVHRPERG